MVTSLQLSREMNEQSKTNSLNSGIYLQGWYDFDLNHQVSRLDLMPFRRRHLDMMNMDATEVDMSQTDATIC